MSELMPVARSGEAPIVSSHGLNQALQLLEEDKDPDFRHYFRVIMRRKWTVFLFLVLVLIGTWVHTNLSIPIYKSKLVMELEYGAPRALSIGSAGDLRPWMMGGRNAFLETQYRVLKSRPVVERAVITLKLAENANFVAPKISSWSDTLLAFIPIWLTGKTAGADPPHPLDQKISVGIAVHRVLSGFTVTPIKGSNLVTLGFANKDRKLVPKVLSALAQAFIEIRLEHNTGASVLLKRRLVERRKLMQEQLEQSEAHLVGFARKHGIVDIESRRTLNSERLTLMSNALLEVEKRRIELGSEYETLAKGGEGHSMVLDSLVIQQLKDRRSKLEAEYQKGRKIFKPAYPKMQQLLGQIEEVQLQITAEIKIILASRRAAYESVLQQEVVLAKRVDELNRDVMSLEDYRAQHNILRRDVDTNQQLYDGLVQRIKEMGVAEIGGSDNTISVVDQASAAYQVSPNLRKNLQLALVIGLAGGIGLAFFIEYLDDTFKSIEDIEQELHLPVIGVVPKIKEAKAKTGPLGLYSTKDKKSAFAEAFRSARTALLFATAAGAPKVLHFTSAGSSEGKTTCAANTAITFTQTGSSVLLIDCDMRKPSMHKLFNLDEDQGLTNYLAGSAKPEEISRATQIPRLFVIPSGITPPNPAELLSSAKMIDLVSLGASKFDYVILDGPPVLGLADALILANLAKRSALVIEMGVARRKHIKGALKRLGSARAHIVGCYMSKIGKMDDAYGYYNSYHYYYYQDQSSSKKIRNI